MLDEWSDCIKLYPEISRLSLSGAVLESGYVSDKQTMSNLWNMR